jgi:hypothetical protein
MLCQEYVAEAAPFSVTRWQCVSWNEQQPLLQKMLTDEAGGCFCGARAYFKVAKPRLNALTLHVEVERHPEFVSGLSKLDFRQIQVSLISTALSE